MKCDACGNEEAIPFKCRYCRGMFCSVHRLPPNHACQMLDRYLERPAKDREFIERVQGRSGSPQERTVALIRNALLLRFSRIELVHLLVGTGLVTAVGLSLNGYMVSWDFLAIFISAFMVHEFGHKFLAQVYHAWAEFRVLLFGAAMTAISALPLLTFKFIAPGAVFIGGSLSESRHGRVALIGPLTNLAMGAGFAIAYYLAALMPISVPTDILVVGAKFNGWIAIFNLIPFMGLDGSKIFSWSKITWILTMAGAVGLFVASDLMSGGGTLRFLTRWF